jgi:hypothetical protein
MVPKIPLHVQLGADLLLVVFEAVLTALDLVASRGNTGEVQTCLTIHALITAALEARARALYKK